MALAYSPKTGLLIHGTLGDMHLDALMRKWRLEEVLVQCVVISNTLTAPPESPADGDCYVPAASATGAWAGKSGQLARWSSLEGVGWEFIPPQAGWTLTALSTGFEYRHAGGVWMFSRGAGATADRPNSDILPGADYFDTTTSLSNRYTGSGWAGGIISVAYDDLIANYDPGDYPGRTFSVPDFGNVPVKPSVDGTRWIAQRPFVLAAGNPNSSLTGTTAETPMHEVRIPVGILGAAPSIKVITASLATTGGDRQLRYRLSNTSGGVGGTQMYFGAAGSTLLLTSPDFLNYGGLVWGATVTSAQFTSSGAAADVYLKTTYQLSASGASATLQAYCFLATPGGE